MQRIVVSCASEFMSQAADELRRAFTPGPVRLDALSGGVLLASLDRLRDDILRTLRRDPPIFIRHIFPVDAELALTGTRDDLTAIAAAAQPLLATVPAAARVAVQARRLSESTDYTPFAVKETLDPLLSGAGLTPEIREPQWVVSLLLTDRRGYVGVSRVEDNLSAWAGGMMRFRAEDNDIARSKRKLLEALSVFAVDLSYVRSAIDLGAAPGGWTAALVERGLTVTAVDTGLLDERVRSLPQVTFLQQNAEDVRLRPASFDLLTSDISWEPTHTAEMIVRLAPALRPRGLAIVTVKLMGRRVWPTIAAVRAILERAFVIRGARHLFHNRREITLFLERRETDERGCHD
ncbi:MAG: SAM-dependent methyltransferase [Chloroflexota bacterium]